jgi:hypothetical protein
MAGTTRKKNVPTSTWKVVENKILAYWGVRRRGAYVRGERGGKPDSPDSLVGWAVEVKHTKRPQWNKIVDAVQQSEINAPSNNDIPVAVIHQEGTSYKDSLVVMRLEKFAEFFINRIEDQDEQQS